MPDPSEPIPVQFVSGEALTAGNLNKLQHDLLARILTHDHSGNGQSPQKGVRLGGAGIQPAAVEGGHIKSGSIASGHFSAGAVNSNALGEDAVLESHLSAGAVGTNALKDSSVTRQKLSPNLAAVLDSLGGGASTFGYFVFLDGNITYPPETEYWYDWMLDPDIDLTIPEVSIYRLSPDGNWQPARAAGLVQDAPMSATVVSGASTEGAVSYRSLSFSETAGAAAQGGAVPLAVLKSGLLADYRLVLFGELPADLVERRQIKVDIETRKYSGLLSTMSGKIALNPGVGGTEAFHDEGPVDFLVPANERTYGLWAVARRIAYHFGVVLEGNTPPIGDAGAALLTRLYTVVQHPERVLAGYWTGATQNIRSVVRINEASVGPFVRVRFAVPYRTPTYVVQLSVDHTSGTVLVPAVLRRYKDYVDLAFWNGSTQSNQASFSLSVVGELSTS